MTFLERARHLGYVIEEHDGIYSFQVGYAGCSCGAEILELILFEVEAKQKATVPTCGDA
jgi:hypothetical protein